MKESYIERMLKKKVEQVGGKALKFVSPGWAGAPDRLVLLPGGRLVFVELKAPGRKPRPLQLKRHEELQALGFDVAVIDTPEGVDDFIRRYAKCGAKC